MFLGVFLIALGLCMAIAIVLACCAEWFVRKAGW